MALEEKGRNLDSRPNLSRNDEAHCTSMHLPLIPVRLENSRNNSG